MTSSQFVCALCQQSRTAKWRCVCACACACACAYIRACVRVHMCVSVCIYYCYMLVVGLLAWESDDYINCRYTCFFWPPIYAFTQRLFVICGLTCSSDNLQLEFSALTINSQLTYKLFHSYHLFFCSFDNRVRTTGIS